MSLLWLLIWVAFGITVLSVVPSAFVLGREAIRRRRARRAAVRLSEMRAVLDRIRHEPADSVASALAERFDKRTILAVLEEDVEGDNKTSLELYDRLGFRAKWERCLRGGRTWSERAHAARMLGKLGVSSATPMLVAAIADPEEDTTVRLAAAEAIASIGDSAVLPYLCRALANPSEASAPCVAEALVSFGPSAVAPVLAVLDDERPMARLWAARVLGRIGHGTATQSLVARLSDASVIVRVAAAEALGHIGDPQGSQALACAALSDPSAQVRARAAAALSKSTDPDAVLALCAGLGDTDAEVRASAVDALVALRPRDQSPIERALFDPCEDSRRGAALALDRLGAVSKWTTRLGDSSAESRAAARAALVAVARAGLSDSISAAFKHEDAAIRAGICGVLGELGAPRYVPLLAKALGDEAASVQLSAAIALGRVGGEAAASAFNRDKPPGIPDEVWSAAQASATSPSPSDRAPPSNVRSLSEARRGAKMSERIRAILELADHAGPECTAALAEVLVSDPMPEVRALAARMLARVEERWLAMPALVRAMADPAKEVAEAATKALAAGPSGVEVKVLRTPEPQADANGSARRTTGRMRRKEGRAGAA